MKAFVCICLFAVMGAALARPHDDADKPYPTKYDDVDVLEVVTNDRLLDPYMDCLLDLGRCTTEAKELKSHVKEAMVANCARCNKIQKEKTEIVIGYLINHKPEHWQKLVAKYDPDHKYSKKYEEQLSKLKKQSGSKA